MEFFYILDTSKYNYKYPNIFSSNKTTTLRVLLYTFISSSRYIYYYNIFYNFVYYSFIFSYVNFIISYYYVLIFNRL